MLARASQSRRGEHCRPGFKSIIHETPPPTDICYLTHWTGLASPPQAPSSTSHPREPHFCKQAAQTTTRQRRRNLTSSDIPPLRRNDPSFEQAAPAINFTPSSPSRQSREKRNWAQRQGLPVWASPIEAVGVKGDDWRQASRREGTARHLRVHHHGPGYRTAALTQWRTYLGFSFFSSRVSLRIGSSCSSQLAHERGSHRCCRFFVWLFPRWSFSSWLPPRQRLSGRRGECSPHPSAIPRLAALGSPSRTLTSPISPAQRSSYSRQTLRRESPQGYSLALGRLLS